MTTTLALVPLKRDFRTRRFLHHMSSRDSGIRYFAVAESPHAELSEYPIRNGADLVPNFAVGAFKIAVCKFSRRCLEILSSVLKETWPPHVPMSPASIQRRDSFVTLLEFARRCLTNSQRRCENSIYGHNTFEYNELQRYIPKNIDVNIVLLWNYIDRRETIRSYSLICLDREWKN